MVLGVIESESTKLDPKMLRDLFGFSKKNQYELARPDKVRNPFDDALILLRC